MTLPPLGKRGKSFAVRDFDDHPLLSGHRETIGTGEKINIRLNHEWREIIADALIDFFDARTVNQSDVDRFLTDQRLNDLLADMYND